MAKKSKSCSATKIKFRTKRGRVVEFRGRPGGSVAHGGECPKKLPTAAQRAHRGLFKRAAAVCARQKKSMHGPELARCVKNNIGYSQLKLKRG